MMASFFETILSTWETGGWVMIALAILGIVLYATAARLLLSLHYPGIKHCNDSRAREWLLDPAKAPARIRPLLRFVRDDAASAKEVEGRFREVEAQVVPDVDRSLSTLGVMVVAAPLFGLLGTVSGMLLTFKAISLGGSSVSEIVARGISEALVATQTGLTVAIPGWMVAFVAKRWRAEFVSFLLRLESIALRLHGDEKSDLARPRAAEFRSPVAIRRAAVVMPRDTVTVGTS